MRVAKKPKYQKSATAEAGTGEEVSTEYIARRKRIETHHQPNDDGTERLARHAIGEPELYADHISPTPLNYHDSPERLCEFGLPTRDLNRLLENGCEEIADVESAARQPDEIPSWVHAGEVTLRHVREALKRAGVK